MPKYELIRNEGERFDDGPISLITLEAADDVEALLKVADNCGIGYVDDDYNEWYEDGFEKPSMEELISWIESENGDGGEYIYMVRKFDSRKTIFTAEDFTLQIVNW